MMGSLRGPVQRLLMLEPSEIGPRPFVVLVTWQATLKHWRCGESS